MKTNIYQKLHKAACEAGGVVKGKKVQGMHFNPLLHDDVSKVAMEALLSNGLYPVCTYTNEVTDNFMMVTCNMKIHDIENPTDCISIDGCSALANLDKFGSGNGMSYAKKYAFLNALNLKTGLDNDDGYKATPFNNKESDAKANDNTGKTLREAGEVSVNIEDMKNSFAKAIHLPRLKYLKKTYEPQLKYLQTKNPDAFSLLKQEYESRMEQLNSQS